MQNAPSDEKEKQKKISNMLKRRVTGIVLAVVLLPLWFIQGLPLRIGFVALMVIGIWEMYSAFRVRGARPIRWVGMAYALLTMPLYLRYGVVSLWMLTACSMMVGLGGVILRGEIDFDSAVATLFPLFYPGMLITMLFPLQDLGQPLYASLALGMSFLIALMNDLFAYEIGSKYGNRKLAPILSPKKTVEGAIAGMVASVVFAVLIALCGMLATTYIPMAQPYAAPLPPLWQFALLGLFGGAAGVIGDLTASMVKRYCGIKDFGTMFPGHGGMLDRMDSVIFTGSVVYMFFTLFVR